MGIIYKLTFPSGKSYIGLTVQKLKDRLRAHRGAASIGRRGALFSAMRKYGLRSFNAEVIFIEEDFEKLKSLEIEMIKKHRTKAPSGYNLTDGGDGMLGKVFTAEERTKRSDAQRISFQNPDRKLRHSEAQRNPELIKIRSKLMSERMSDPLERLKYSESMKALWKDERYRSFCLSRRQRGPRIHDGLNKWQRFRLKDLDGYRERKAAYARTPSQRRIRLEYMKQWRHKNRVKYNEYYRLRRIKNKLLLNS